MVEPPFLAATLSVFMALMLVGWAAFNRFGATRRPDRAFALGKRALADNQAALIRMTRREARLGGRYVQAVRDLVTRAVGAPRDLDEPGLDAFLDRLGENRGAGDRFTELARAAAAAKTAALSLAGGDGGRWSCLKAWPPARLDRSYAPASRAIGVEGLGCAAAWRGSAVSSPTGEPAS